MKNIFDLLPKLRQTSLHGRYESDRVTDNTGDFLNRYRLNTARAKRLLNERQATIAAYHQIISDALGAITLTAIFIIIIHLVFAS